MYTYQIEQAIKAAAILHSEQVRKGEVALPYITHLIAVMMIVRDYTSDENTLVAALLHDTVEDTTYTIEEVKTDFGPTVASYVATLTEPSRNRGFSWLETKKMYAKQLRQGPLPAVLIAAADKSHNFRAMVDEYLEDHDGFRKNFGRNLDERLEAYQSIANAINARLKDGIVHEFNHTFSIYKQFLLDVKNSQATPAQS